jgi:hypothetical protein
MIPRLEEFRLSLRNFSTRVNRIEAELADVVIGVGNM